MPAIAISGLTLLGRRRQWILFGHDDRVAEGRRHHMHDGHHWIAVHSYRERSANVDTLTAEPDVYLKEFAGQKLATLAATSGAKSTGSSWDGSK